jgi:adenylosuccinate synthase
MHIDGPILMSIMQNLVVVGLQWGDEGKGKIVDVLSANFDIVARFQGGSNAGHTVKVGNNTFKFRLMPTGSVRGKKVIIGNGVVVDPVVLSQEIAQLQDAGLKIDIMISDRAHLITPYQILLDGLQEAARGSSRVGTTKRGIGPAYADKASRVGIRASNIAQLEGTDEWRVFRESAESKIAQLQGISKDPTITAQLNEFFEALKRIAPLVGDTSEYLNKAIDSGKRVLFEGAQGALLDIDHGTYPFVTSSNCLSAAASLGTGVAHIKLDSVLGIAKAYLTRVGAGPFPTELEDETGQMIRGRGVEYGTVTGRPRRCGWLDLVALKYSVQLNGAQYLALTKADVLTGIDPLKVCVAYEIDGLEVCSIPSDSSHYGRALPVYEEMEGWSKLPDTLTHIDAADHLPDALLSYIKKIESATRAKIAILSLGPDRTDTVFISNVFPDGSIHV